MFYESFTFYRRSCCRAMRTAASYCAEIADSETESSDSSSMTTSD